MIIIFSLTLLILTLVGFSRAHWTFTIFDFFRLQYAVLALFVGAYSVWVGRFDVLILNVLICAINIYRIRLFLPRFRFQFLKKVHKPKSLLSFNAHCKNNNIKKIQTLIQDTNPQVMLIMELTDKHQLALKDELAKYPYTLETPVRDGFKICLFSKSVMNDARITHHGPNDSPLLNAQIEINDRWYSVYSAHPKPALNKEWSDERHEYFKAIEKIIGDDTHSKIMLGDFNSVPWEDHFQTFLKRSKLKSSLIDKGYKITWPVYCLPMGIPMDHILLSPDIKYTDVKVGPSAGSDHYPLSMVLENYQAP